MVAILPTELPDPLVRAKADRLLQRTRELDTDDDECTNELRDLHTALRGRIELVNWNLLEQIYRDFKMGSDRTLRKFVGLQPEAIAILPIHPSTCRVPDNDHHGSHVAKEKVESDPDKRQRSASATRVSKVVYHLRKDTDPVKVDIVQTIRTELDVIEATAPWKQVFDASTITYPFDQTEYPQLAQRFAAFWRRHARAIWQRRFWIRFQAQDREDEYRKQRDRDNVAAQCFVKTVIIPLFEEFGAAFVANLDAQPKRLYWWWYRGPIVDLVKMARAKGVDYYVRYMKAQASKRIPTAQPDCHFRATSHASKSRSMWSTMERTEHIHDAIVLLTQPRDSRRRSSTNGDDRSRKRTRTATVWHDEENSDNHEWAMEF